MFELFELIVYFSIFFSIYISNSSKYIYFIYLWRNHWMCCDHCYNLFFRWDKMTVLRYTRPWNNRLFPLLRYVERDECIFNALIAYLADYFLFVFVCLLLMFSLIVASFDSHCCCVNINNVITITTVICNVVACRTISQMLLFC